MFSKWSLHQSGSMRNQPLWQRWDCPHPQAKTIPEALASSCKLLSAYYFSSGYGKKIMEEKKGPKGVSDWQKRRKDLKVRHIFCNVCWQEVDRRNQSIREGIPLIVWLTVIRWRSFKTCTHYVPLYSWWVGDEERACLQWLGGNWTRVNSRGYSQQCMLLTGLSGPGKEVRTEVCKVRATPVQWRAAANEPP